MLILVLAITNFQTHQLPLALCNNSQYNTSKIRLDRKGWCPLSKTEESWVKIDLLKVGVISDTSSLQEVFYKRNIFRNFAKFTGKHLRQSFFFKHRCFPVNFAKFPR